MNDEYFVHLLIVVNMYKPFLIVLFTIAVVSGQTWVSRARLENHLEYWMKLMQRLIEEVEEREWCNLKLIDISQVINDTLYDFSVSGTVNYLNGFVVSIQKIDVVDIEQLILTRTIDGEEVPHGTVRGKLNFRDMLVGYDVVASLTSPEDPDFRSTGTFLHTLVQIQLELTQNLLSKEMTVWSMTTSVTAGRDGRMQYMPSSNITEAFGRRFLASTMSSTDTWSRDIFIPTMLELAHNELGFPDICFNNCP